MANEPQTRVKQARKRAIPIADFLQFLTKICDQLIFNFDFYNPSSSRVLKNSSIALLSFGCVSSYTP